MVSNKWYCNPFLIVERSYIYHILGQAVYINSVDTYAIDLLHELIHLKYFLVLK